MQIMTSEHVISLSLKCKGRGFKLKTWQLLLILTPCTLWNMFIDVTKIVLCSDQGQPT